MVACMQYNEIILTERSYAVSAYHHWCCEFESRSGRGVQHYVIKFVKALLHGKASIAILVSCNFLYHDPCQFTH